LQKLQADGAMARRAWQLDLPYKDKDVYEIIMPPRSSALRDKVAGLTGDGAAGSHRAFKAASFNSVAAEPK